MDLKVGATQTYTKLITGEMIELFADFSGDRNPIHVDSEFARDQGYEGRVAHGLIPLAFLSAILTETMGDGNVIVSMETKFSQPIIEESEIKIELSLDHYDERFKTFTFKFKMKDHTTGKTKIRGKVTCVNRNIQSSNSSDLNH